MAIHSFSLELFLPGIERFAVAANENSKNRKGKFDFFFLFIYLFMSKVFSLNGYCFTTTNNFFFFKGAFYLYGLPHTCAGGGGYLRRHSTFRRISNEMPFPAFFICFIEMWPMVGEKQKKNRSKGQVADKNVKNKNKIK